MNERSLNNICSVFYLFIRSFISKSLYKYCDPINYLRFIETEDAIYLLSCVVCLFDGHKGTCLRQLFSFVDCKQRSHVVKFCTTIIRQK